MSLVRVTEQVLDVGEHLAAVEDERCGAVVSFVGQVRNHDPAAAGTITGIEYSAHPDAGQILTRIVEELSGSGDHRTDSDVVRIAVSHRIGDLSVGDLALVVCVASAHRDRAYEVSRAVVERIKVELPIWKKQFTAEGTGLWSGL